MSTKHSIAHSARSYIDEGSQAWYTADELKKLPLASLPSKLHDEVSIANWSAQAASEIDVGDHFLDVPAKEEHVADGVLPQITPPKLKRSRQVDYVKPRRLSRAQVTHNASPVESQSKQPASPALSEVTHAIRNTAVKNHKSRRYTIERSCLLGEDPRTVSAGSTYLPVRKVPLYIVRPKDGKPYVPELLWPGARDQRIVAKLPHKANLAKKREAKPKRPVFVPRKASPDEATKQDGDWTVQDAMKASDEPTNEACGRDSWAAVQDASVMESEAEEEKELSPKERQDQLAKTPGGDRKLSKKERKAAAKAAKSKGKGQETSSKQDVMEDAENSDRSKDPFADPKEDDDDILGTANPFDDTAAEVKGEKQENPFDTPKSPQYNKEQDTPKQIDKDSPTPANIVRPDPLVEPPTMSSALPPGSIPPPIPPDFYKPGYHNIPSHPYHDYYHSAPTHIPNNTYYSAPTHIPNNTYYSAPADIPDNVYFNPTYSTRQDPAPTSPLRPPRDHPVPKSTTSASSSSANGYIPVPHNPYNIQGGKTHGCRKAKKKDGLNEVWGGIPVRVATWKWPKTWKSSEKGSEAGA